MQTESGPGHVRVRCGRWPYKHREARNNFWESIRPHAILQPYGGWLIFAVPPAALGVHPADGPTYDSGVRHQLAFMCDDIHATIRELRAKGIDVRGEPRDEGYGITVMLALPGGVEVMLYEPRHAVAIEG